ncbi:MAG TPA: hypothetical protein VFC74_04010 [Oscillospiraceae bacterium]|nr:hypothetical protein [Oscillospiraceae bacterium]
MWGWTQQQVDETELGHYFDLMIVAAKERAVKYKEDLAQIDALGM